MIAETAKISNGVITSKLYLEVNISRMRFWMGKRIINIGIAMFIFLKKNAVIVTKTMALIMDI